MTQRVLEGVSHFEGGEMGLDQSDVFWGGFVLSEQQFLQVKPRLNPATKWLIEELDINKMFSKAAWAALTKY